MGRTGEFHFNYFHISFFQCEQGNHHISGFDLFLNNGIDDLRCADGGIHSKASEKFFVPGIVNPRNGPGRRNINFTT